MLYRDHVTAHENEAIRVRKSTEPRRLASVDYVSPDEGITLFLLLLSFSTSDL